MSAREMADAWGMEGAIKRHTSIIDFPDSKILNNDSEISPPKIPDNWQEIITQPLDTIHEISTTRSEDGIWAIVSKGHHCDWGVDYTYSLWHLPSMKIKRETKHSNFEGGTDGAVMSFERNGVGAPAKLITITDTYTPAPRKEIMTEEEEYEYNFGPADGTVTTVRKSEVLSAKD